MSESLQDQLLALGLAKEKPQRKRRKPRPNRGQRGSGSQQAKGRQGGTRGKNGEISLDAAYRARARDEKSTAEKAKAEKRALDLERRRLNTEIASLLKDQGLNDREGELKRNFLYKGKIRSVRVNAEQLAALNDGTLALVFLRGDYLVVKPELAETIRAISAEHVPDLGGDEPAEEEHPVPDDLVW